MFEMKLEWCDLAGNVVIIFTRDTIKKEYNYTEKLRSLLNKYLTADQKISEENLKFIIKENN